MVRKLYDVGVFVDPPAAPAISPPPPTTPEELMRAARFNRIRQEHFMGQMAQGLVELQILGGERSLASNPHAVVLLAIIQHSEQSLKAVGVSEQVISQLAQASLGAVEAVKAVALHQIVNYLGGVDQAVERVAKGKPPEEIVQEALGNLVHANLVEFANRAGISLSQPE